MSKTSKKRGFLKISKWGKFLKLTRPKKKEKKTNCEEEKFGNDELELNKTRKAQETTALIVEKTTGENVLEFKDEAAKLEERTESEDCSVEEKKVTVKVDLCQKFEQEIHVQNGRCSSHMLDRKKTESENVEVANENDLKQEDDEDNGNSTPKEKGLDQVSDVIVHTTPSPKRQVKQDMKTNNDEKDEVLAFAILPTPSPKIQKSEDKMQKVFSVRKDKNEIDEDSVIMAAPVSTPTQKKSENRESRVLTVKKIRSIIATPYKRLKREGSLLDGQTYRYIEIQSLVNAIQSMHPCIGSMIACNEKGLQYGKSSVLRIECKECNAKVFLQASKN